MRGYNSSSSSIPTIGVSSSRGIRLKRLPEFRDHQVLAHRIYFLTFEKKPKRNSRRRTIG
uniref:Uncharacterized protein n=1 Tax=Utricularia reniformis TaxID=192314 RepID=A0A1Y0AYU2_9LAMI|nr:hypothetical protein AEK19_MT0816 [Utricularia reniformis]ART30318.1 hypothetical protein AEK19_MT0816 [Utricularia reniformis]